MGRQTGAGQDRRQDAAPCEVRSQRAYVGFRNRNKDDVGLGLLDGEPHRAKSRGQPFGVVMVFREAPSVMFERV